MRTWRSEDNFIDWFSPPIFMWVQGIELRSSVTLGSHLYPLNQDGFRSSYSSVQVACETSFPAPTPAHPVVHLEVMATSVLLRTR